MEEEQIFIRSDLDRISGGGVAYYRLDANMRDFLNRCLKQHGDIEGIILNKEEGDYHWNMGFILPKE